MQHSTPAARRRHVLVAAAAVLATLLVGCGHAANEASDDTPGYDGNGRKVDTSPFQMANPSTTDGATTIPGPGPTLAIADQFTTTTTTTLPSTIDGGAGPGAAANGGGGSGGGNAESAVSLGPAEIPDPGNSTAQCQAYYLVADAGYDITSRFKLDPNTDLSVVRERLVGAFTQAINILNQREHEGVDTPVLVTLRGRISEMRDRAAAADTIAKGGLVYVPLQRPRTGDEQVGWPEILAHLTANCAAVVIAFGSTDSV